MRTLRVPETAEEVAGLDYQEALEVFRSLTWALESGPVSDLRRTVGERLYALSAAETGRRSSPRVIADLGHKPDGRPWLTVSRFYDVLRGRAGGVYPVT